MLTIGAGGFVLLAIGGTVAVIAGTAVAFGAGTGWAGLLHYIATAEHPAHAGGVAGMLLTFGNIGGFLGPSAFGLLAEKSSYAASWIMLAVVALVAAAAVMAAGRGFARRRAGCSGELVRAASGTNSV